VSIHPQLILRLIDIMLRSLGSRVLSFLSLAMTFTLYAWAMYRSTWIAYTIATTFGIAVTWPVLYVGWKKGDSDDQPTK
jgi:hypothetical protein